MKSKAKKLKEILGKDQSGKGMTDPGRNPYDQWSAKAGISEDTVVDTFLKYHGINPEYVTHEKRAAHGRSRAFKKWKKDIKLGAITLNPVKASESVELDELSHQTVDTYVKKSKDDIKKKGPGDSLDHVNKVLKRLRGLKAAGKRVTFESNGQEDVYGGDSGKTGESMNTDGKTEDTPTRPKKNIWNRRIRKEEAPRGKNFQIHKDKVDAAIKTVRGNISAAVNPKKKEESVLIDDPKGTITRVAEENKDCKQAQVKSARMIKALYKKHRVTEEIYDWEKDDKKPATTGGKKPKLVKADETRMKDPNTSVKPMGAGIQGQEISKGQPDAAAVLTGGTTMTGKPRDDVEIDPMMRQRPGQPDPTKKGKDKTSGPEGNDRNGIRTDGAK